MDVFVWEGRSRKGTIEKGEMEAASESAVRMALRRQQIQATKIQSKPKDILKGSSCLGRDGSAKRKSSSLRASSPP